MRVMVTGAAGFIGLSTVREAVRRGFDVVALTHRSTHPELDALAASGAVQTLRADLAEIGDVRAAFASCPAPDAIIHCAGRASDVGWARAFRRANYDSVVNLGTLCKEAGNCRLVFVSTTDVYGLRDFYGESEDDLPLDERARNSYPRFKILAEKWIRSNLPAEQYAIIRPAAVWGEGDPTLLPRFRAFLASSPVIIHFGISINATHDLRYGTPLDLAGCAHLRQLHLASNPVPASVCDKWFIDLDAAVTGPVVDADFYFPAASRTSASDQAFANLVAKGFSMHPN